MTLLHIDFETRSAADLEEVGLDNYARDPSTDVWCMGYAYDEGPVGRWIPGLPCPIFNKGWEDVRVVAHNAAFELAIWNEVMVKGYDWPGLKPEQMECTQAMAYAMALPGSLEKAAAAVGIKQQKDMAGHRLMLQMCAPKTVHTHSPGLGLSYPTGYTWHDEPDKLARLYEYCKQDVEVERELYKRLVRLSDKERKVWLLDYKINRRGVHVDVPAVKAMSEMVLSEQDRLNTAIRRATDNAVGFTTEVARITKWVRAQGVEIDGLAKADVLDALDGDLPPAVRAVLKIRKEAGRSSTAKLNRIASRAGQDGRVRGIFQYHGAGTGRWAGRDVQPHNFPRPTLTPEEVDKAIGLIRAKEYGALQMIYGPPMSVAADCLRGTIDAAPGHDLLAGDFANIEGRVLAWLAGEEWKLQAFRDYDTILSYDEKGKPVRKGPDVYKATYSKSFGVLIAAVDYVKRQIGKVEELAFGYQGGLGAWRTMEKAYPDVPDMTDEQVEDIKERWRDAHPSIVGYWHELEGAAISAVLSPGQKFTAGAKGRQVTYKKVGSFLWCGLPSGRALCYPYPKLQEIDTPWGEKKDALTYMTVVSASGIAKAEKIIPDEFASVEWQRVATYGGKLAENVTQACARDVLAEAMLRLDDAGFDIVMHVHDEVVVEIPERELAGDGAESMFANFMALTPDWAPGLPIAVETWRGRRYRK